MRECYMCEYYKSMEWCPNSSLCYSLEDKPNFKLHHRYKSKIICKDKIYYNIHHFNKFQKWFAKIFWKIKIEDC